MSTSIDSDDPTQARFGADGTRRGTPDSEAGGDGAAFPFVPTLLLFVLVGGLIWWSGEGPSGSSILVENPADEARRADIVWKGSGGGVSGTLLRVLEPNSALRFRIPEATTGCVRWIQEGGVRAAWPLSGGGVGQDLSVLPLRTPRSGSTSGCPPELVDHRIRPTLGRWMIPGEPARIHRERMIPRRNHRRNRFAGASNRRSRGRDGDEGSLGSFSWWLDLFSDPPTRSGERRVTYWHLTPRGWIRGGWTTRDDAEPDRPPGDRAMTCAHVEERPTRLVQPGRRLLTMWKGKPDHARTLVRRFGDCPGSHDRRSS